MSHSTRELETQRFLREHTLEELARLYGSTARRHAQHPNLVMLKYSQINSPMGERVVQECRGLILDEADDWAVVSFPYTKFFNHGEPLAAEIDWSTACVLEKVDGSLMTLYPYRGEWHVASSGQPDARGPVGTLTLSFRELFWQTWKALGYRLPDLTSERFSFMFELMTPENRVLVRHEKPRLILHGVRNLETLEEQDPAPVAERMGWECVGQFPFGSLEAVRESACALDPLHCEGYVVRDAAFNRIKIKGERYVAISHAGQGAGPRSLLELVRTGEAPEFLAYFPGLETDYRRIEEGFNRLVAETEQAYEEHRGIETQKDFAAAVKALPYSACLFQMRAGKVTGVAEFYRTAHIDSLMRLLGLKEAPGPVEE